MGDRELALSAWDGRGGRFPAGREPPLRYAQRFSASVVCLTWVRNIVRSLPVYWWGMVSLQAMPTKILQNKEDFFDWDKLIAHCDVLEGLEEHEKQQAKEAFRIFREEFGS